MSFYSALVLAANVGVRPPSPAAARFLLDELGLLDRANADAEFGNLASDITDLFADETAKAKAQAAAIVAYLEFKREADEFGRESIDQALANFWRRRAAGADAEPRASADGGRDSGSS